MTMYWAPLHPVSKATLFVCILLVLVPVGRSQTSIDLPCSGNPLSLRSYSITGDGVSSQGYWGAGTGGSAYYGNQVVGVSSVSSFTFYLSYSSGTALLAEGQVIDAQSRTLLQSVPISVPTSGSNFPVTATFPSPLAPLLVTSTYYLVLTVDASNTGTGQYDLFINMNSNGAVSCSSSCVSVVPYGTRGLVMDVTYACAPPSPSPSASISPSTSPTPSNSPSPSSSASSSPTPSISASPSSSASSSPSNSPSPSSSPSSSPTPSLSVSPSSSATSSPSNSPSPSSSPSSSTTPSFSASPSSSASPTTSSTPSSSVTPSLTASPSPSSSPSSSASPTASLTPSSSATPSLTASPSPSTSPSPSASSSVTASASRTPSPSIVSPSPSTSPLPTVVAVKKASVAFNTKAPAVNMSGSSSLSSTVQETTQVSLTSSGVIQQTTTVFYKSTLTGGGADGNATALLGQLFSFSNATTQVQVFPGDPSVTFTVAAFSIKWAIQLNATTSAQSAGGGESFDSALNLTYALCDLSPLPGGVNATDFTTNTSDIVVVSIPLASDANITVTTYYLPLLYVQGQTNDIPVAAVEVLDTALVDGQQTKIRHWVVPPGSTNVTTAAAKQPVYTLILEFPAFNTSVDYDPVLSLGTLVETGSGGSSGSNNIGLIVGTSVGITLGVAFVLGVIATAISVSCLRARSSSRRKRHRQSVNFDSYDL